MSITKQVTEWIKLAIKLFQLIGVATLIFAGGILIISATLISNIDYTLIFRIITVGIILLIIGTIITKLTGPKQEVKQNNAQ